MEKLKKREKPKSRICKRWLVMERCAWCVFETLHRYQDQKERLEIQEKEKGENTTNGHSPNRC